jgi:hypothetical protein
VEFERPTRTSAEAADAIGCSVAEIDKSIVFRGKTSGQAVVVVASGDNRVSETKVAAKLGEPLARADADFDGLWPMTDVRQALPAWCPALAPALVHPAIERRRTNASGFPAALP